MLCSSFRQLSHSKDSERSYSRIAVAHTPRFAAANLVRRRNDRYFVMVSHNSITLATLYLLECRESLMFLFSESPNGLVSSQVPIIGWDMNSPQTTKISPRSVVLPRPVTETSVRICVTVVTVVTVVTLALHSRSVTY